MPKNQQIQLLICLVLKIIDNIHQKGEIENSVQKPSEGNSKSWPERFLSQAFLLI